MTSTPPGPFGLPLIGNTVGHVREQGGFYERVADEHGGLARLRLVGVGEFYFVSDPDLVERLLVSEGEHYRKHRITRRLLGELLGDGLVLSEGDLWERQRRLVGPAFHYDQIETYAGVMLDNAQRTVDQWVPGETYDVLDEMQELTLRIIIESMFGTRIDYEQWNVRASAEALQEPGKPLKQPIGFAVPKWVPIPMWRRYHRAVDQFDRLIEEMIRRRREDTDPADDLLSMLLQARDREGDRMSDEQVRDELMTVLFAGHETTAIALTFVIYALTQHPEVQETLAAELESVLGGEPPSMVALADLEYTEHVVKEAMRLYPPVPAVPRETVTDVELGGYELAEGSMVVASPWAVHRSPELYDDPLEFRPERWAAPDDRPTFAYFPFGGGDRRCLGQHFAMVESQLVLATLAQQFSFDLVSEPDPDLSVTVTTRPIDEIDVRVTERPT